MRLLTMLTTSLIVFAAPMFAFAADDMAAGGDRPMYAIAKALAIGIAALGGTLGQGKLVAAALEGIARNPGAADKVFTPLILGLAFVESLVIFALLIAFMIQA